MQLSQSPNKSNSGANIMNDKRTEAQKYLAWVDMVNKSAERGWAHVDGWNFKAPNGTVYDLSATDPNKLEFL